MRSDDFDLLVRPNDKDDAPYVLMVGVAPLFRFAGWKLGRDCKRAEWVRTHGDRPPAYFVPQAFLGDLESLRVFLASEKTEHLNDC
jgi:hypothetical protein